MSSCRTVIRALVAVICLAAPAPTAQTIERVFLDPGRDPLQLPYRLIVEDKLDNFTDAGQPTRGLRQLYGHNENSPWAACYIIDRWKYPDSAAAFIFYKDIDCTEAIWQYNLPAPSISNCLAFDADSDGIDEVAAVYSARDTVWLLVLNAISKTSQQVPLSTGVDRDGNNHWDGNGQLVGQYDINNDHMPELFINIDVGYDLYPRELICYSPIQQAVLWRYPISGIVAGGNFHVGPLHPGGPPMIVAGINSKGNAAVAGDMDDLHSYLIVLDATGQLRWRQTVGPAFSTALPVLTDVNTDDSLEILIAVRRASDVEQVPLTDSVGSLCLFSESGQLITSHALSSSEPRWARRLTACSVQGIDGQEIIATLNDGSIAVFDGTLAPLSECYSSGPLSFVGLTNLLDSDECQLLLSTGDQQLFLTNQQFKLLASLDVDASIDGQFVQTLPASGDRPPSAMISTNRGARLLTISARPNSWMTIFNRNPWLAFFGAFLPLFLLLSVTVVAWRQAKSRNRVIRDQREELERTLANMEEVKDRLKAAEQLHEARTRLQIQEENFRTVVENSLQAVIICQGDSIVYANSVVADVAEMTVNALQGMKVSEAISHFICPEYQASIRANHEALQAGLIASNRTEIEVRGLSGKTHWMDLFSHASNFGGERSVIVMMVDICKRKEALRRLAESEESASAMLNATGDLAVLFDTQSRIIRVNTAMQQMLGKTEEELVGTCLEASLPPAVANTRLEHVNKLLETGERFEFEDTSNGRHYFHTGYPIKNDQGNIVRIVVFSRDITELREHLDELRELRAAVEQTIAGIAIADNEGMITYVNRSWANMHGYEPDEVTGQHLGIFHSPDQIADDVEPFNMVVRTEGSNHGPVGHRHRSGRLFPTLMSSTLIVDESGNPCGMVGTAVDITDRQNLQVELERKTRQLKWLTSQMIKLQEADRHMIARELHDSVAHQLSVAKMMVERLRLANSHNEDGVLHQELSETITSAMRDIRQISSHLRPRMMDTLGLVATMEWTLGQMPAGIDVQFEIKGSDVDLDQNLSINLYRIFQELVLNVTRHAEASRVTVKLTIDRDKIVLDFVDNGRGFDLTTVTDDWENKNSFGILNITERVQMVGGTIKIDTSPGLGTHFLIETPITEGNAVT